MSKRGRGEGSVYQDTEGRWTGSVHLGYENGKRKRKVIHGETQAAVIDEMKKILDSQRRGIPIQTKSDSVKDFITAWLENTVKPSVRPKTYRSYEQMVRNHIVPVLGSRKLEKLNIQDVQAFMADRLMRGHKIATKQEDGTITVTEGPSSPALVRYLRVVLRAALTDAMRAGLI